MLPLLDGMFAFAIWDPRDRSLFLARDPLGIKPLYVATPRQGVLFASEIKALLASPAVSRDLDIQAIDATIRHLWCPGPRTVLAGVRKLEPGGALQARDGRVVREWRYFDLPVQEPWTGPPPADLCAAMTQHLERAVRDQMISDVPVGAFLSGGLDSSAVAAFAARHAERLPCFTMRFRSGDTAAEGFADDLPYARRVAAHLGVELIEVPIGGEVAGEIEQMIYQLDEPQADVAPLNVRRIAEAARAHGIKVLLSGAGGDDLFAGYRRHQVAIFERYWTWLPASARRALRNASGLLSQRRVFARRINKALRYADLDLDHRIVGYFDWITASERAALFQPDVAAALAAAPPYQPLLDSIRRLPAGVHPVNRMLYLDGRYFLPDHNLNYTDKMAMAAGVEVRVPLLAVDLVRFASQLPVGHKLHGRTGKWILRAPSPACCRSSRAQQDRFRRAAPTWPTASSRRWSERCRARACRARAVRSHRRQACSSRLQRRIDAAYLILALVCVSCGAGPSSAAVVGDLLAGETLQA
jgi:asparagine synthase (glutamine-hydrolysing)